MKSLMRCSFFKNYRSWNKNISNLQWYDAWTILWSKPLNTEDDERFICKCKLNYFGPKVYLINIFHNNFVLKTKNKNLKIQTKINDGYHYCNYYDLTAEVFFNPKGIAWNVLQLWPNNRESNENVTHYGGHQQFTSDTFILLLRKNFLSWNNSRFLLEFIN